ncbi:ATP-utilizing enzyme of the PP-loop superfamily [Olavius sp. associated proteobacterium Delta 1]|nr:ATP-utilizing enzyme of the PP-loop superfamily [Olavius sp. associated proteobacterium Delta 1]
MKTELADPEQIVNPASYAKNLVDFFKMQQHAIVAYSGGVDSALLAYAAHRALEDAMVAVLADSPSLSRREYRHAINFAQTHGIPLQIIRTREMENPAYQVNQADRCYHCKKALFEKIDSLRRQLLNSSNVAPWPISYGVNVDDLGDYRPGMQAAREASIQAPYVDLGITKQTIRQVCAYYKLEIADKPAMPCMASRIAYGEEVTEEKLSQVESAEDFLYDIGLRVLRVRHHGDTARIEVPVEEFEPLINRRMEISKKFHELGFLYVSLDLDGFKSGSLNAVLEPTTTR